MRIVPTFLSAAVLSLLVVAAQANGGFLAPCRADSDCAGDRTCRALKLELSDILGVKLEDVEESVSGACEDSSDYCVCFLEAEQPGPCRNDDSCLDSEECMPEASVCVSKAQAEAIEDIRKGEEGSFCRDILGISITTLECASDRVCVDVFSSDVVSGGLCLAKFTPATPSGDNAASEGTANGDDTSAGANGASDDGEDDSSEVCIAAKSLAHIQQKDLLYPNHIPARVLCDSFESCATPGHMVRYRRQPMMMKSYCKLVGGCTRAVMHVNSPRYQRALEVPSDTPHLSFTAFAARYTSKLEEHVLRTAVRMGL